MLKLREEKGKYFSIFKAFQGIFVLCPVLLTMYTTLLVLTVLRHARCGY